MKKKLLIITSLFPNAAYPNISPYNVRQFAELSVYYDIKLIAPVSWAVKINYFLKKKKIFPKYDKSYGMEVLYPTYYYTPAIGRSFYWLFYLMSIIIPVYRILKQNKINMIFSTWAYPDAVAGAMLSRIFKKKHIFKVHGTDINDYLKYNIRRFFIKWAIENSSGVVCVSKALSSKIKELGDFNNKIYVIYNGIDLSERKITANRERSEYRNIIFVGNLKSVKGVEYLIDAFTLAINDIDCKCKLKIVGDGSLSDTLKRQVMESGLNGVVEFLGSLPHKEVMDLISSSDLLCLPSLNEGLPNVVLEAFSCGVPVVGSNVGGIPEIVIDGVNGYLTVPRNVESLANGIKKSLESKWDAKKIKESIRDFNWGKNALKLKDIIERGK